MKTHAKKRETIARTIIYTSVFSIIIMSLSAFFIHSDMKYNKRIVGINEERLVILEKEIIENEIRLLKEDVFIIRAHSELKNYLSGESSLDNLRTELLEFSNIRDLYNQVRLIDKNGMEIIRIDNDGVNARQVSEENLQNKSGRYYFKDTFKLDRDFVYISPLDLNIENGEVEKSDNRTNFFRESIIGYVKPMIRMGTPYYYQGSKEGIILINYFGQHLLDTVERFSKKSKGTVILSNSEGFFMIGPQRSLEWGFMQEFENISDANMQNFFPEEWKIINSEDDGQFHSSNGLFTYQTIYPIESNMLSSSGSGKAFEDSKEYLDNNEFRWKIISIVPKNAFSYNHDGLFIFFLTMNGVLIIIFAFISYLYSRSRVKEEMILDKLNKSNQTKTLFLDILRHDILNSITVVKGNMNLLLKKRKEKPIENSLSSIGNIEELIDSAKRYSLVEDELSLSKEDIDLKNLIEEICKEMRPLYKKEGMKLINKVRSSITVKANKLIRESIINLLTNSLKYAKEGKNVEIFSEEGKKTRIMVQDHGPGIPDEHKEEIFKRLERKDKRAIKGTGLGLTIAKKIVQLHGGRIWVEDNPKGGAIFIIEL